MQQQMAFYGEMPDTYQLVVNVNDPRMKVLIEESEKQEKETLVEQVKNNQQLKQIVDLALLSNGMLKGEALSNFVKRGFEMI